MRGEKSHKPQAGLPTDIQIPGNGLDAAAFHARIGVEAAALDQQSLDMLGVRRRRAVAACAAGREAELCRHRVFATVAKGLTAQQAPAGQQRTAQRTEADHGNPCIIGTSRVKATARSQQRTEPALVSAY
jgi:hypothetical protein